MRYLIGLLAVIAALVALAAGVNRWETNIEKRGYDRAQAEYNERAIAAGAVQRDEEKRRQQEQQLARDTQAKELETARADAALANDAVVGLRKRLAEIGRNRGTGLNLSTAGVSPTAAEIGDVLGECAERHRDMAKEADTARTAGLLCERTYDALTPVRIPIRQQVREALRK